MSTTLPTAPVRTEYPSTHWELTDLLPDANESTIQGEMDRLEKALAAFEGHRKELSADLGAEEFLAVLQEYERLDELLTRLSGYASLWFSSDTQSTEALSFQNRVQQVMTEAQNRLLFFSLWWKGLDDEEAARLCPDHEDFRYFLEELRRFKPHTLDERSEQIINIKSATGISAVMTIFSMLSNRLEFELDLDGEKKSYTDGEMRSFFYSPKPEVRETCYGELFRVYEREAPVLGQIYATRVRDWHNEYVDLRGFSSPIAVRNLANDVPDAAVQCLLDVAHRNAPLFQEYFRLKAGWLGMDKLRRYDMYAPLATSEKNIPFTQGARSVLDTFHAFDPRFSEMAERVFSKRHIDSEVRKGKRGGAFCSTLLPQLTPWVMLTYTGRVRDVATLAHELGHALHSMLASDHSVFTQHPSLPLAETASVFCEMLMTRRLLDREQDPLVRRELLASAMDDIYATVLRQAYFVRFELAAHQAVLDNRSTDELCDLYLENLNEQFADSMEIDERFRFEWVSIPHLFRTPFYCYAYSFGQLLVLALFRRYQEQGESFKPGYFRLLSYGGSARPEEILRELDIDITTQEFWQGGFDVVRGMMDELKALAV